MKKSIICFMTIIVGMLICSCSNSTKVEDLQIEFSEFYQSAPFFDETETLLKAYFNILNTAWRNSDKTHLNTFILPSEYEEVESNLSQYSKLNLSGTLNSKTDMDRMYRNSKLFAPYLEAEKMIKELDLLVSVNNDVENKQWFKDFEEFITDTCEEYSTFVENK